VAMLAEMVDAVIGVDTHRDFNQVEIMPSPCRETSARRDDR
jgi:hypothetical protein